MERESGKGCKNEDILFLRKIQILPCDRTEINLNDERSTVGFLLYKIS